MKTQRRLAPLFAAVPFLLLPIGGCYTQLGSMEDAYDDTGIVEEEIQEEFPAEEFDRDYPSSNYYATFTYYQPGVAIGFGWYDPWYYSYYPGWCAPYYPGYGWCVSPPVYACWPYAPVYYPTPYYGHYYPGGSYPGGGTPYASDTRDFGRTRGFTDGTRRTRGGSGIAPRTNPSGGSDERIATVSRQLPPRRTGTVAANPGGTPETPKRQVTKRRTPPSRGTVSTPPPPSTRSGNATPQGTRRGSVSTPPRSTPAPSSPGGNQSQARSSGGQRSGGRR
ncbi:MAG: hypothetical protein OEV30_00025 [Ignavibacteria bacterium]|nr:hypothetical protein [Ignavibacteria bacterium]